MQDVRAPGNESPLLRARTLWYRVLSQKIPHTKCLYQIGKVDSQLCQVFQEHQLGARLNIMTGQVNLTSG
jgi:hypothetical protein